MIAQRYELRERLGAGGWGEVWSALDDATGDTVAVKWIHAVSPEALSIARREVTALRALALPGVVRMRDEGIEGAGWFIVMDRVAGEPFPGESVPTSWDRIRDTAFHLLEVLAGVHAAGSLHLDLKPNNVFVGSDGRVTLLDFGLARGAAVDSRGSMRTRFFTEAHAAPEQLEGDEVDERTDVHGVGRMVALSLASRPLEAGASLREPCPDAPAHVVEAVDAMLSLRKDDRPATALDALQRLGGTCPPLLGPDGLPPGRLPDPAGEERLRSLFHGPDRFLHLREDAARLLFERTQGRLAAVEAELRTWARAGLVHWSGDALKVTRDSLENLRAGVSLSDHEGVPEWPAILATARRQSEEKLDAGRPGEAWHHVQVGLVAARELEDGDAEHAFLRHHVVIALAKELPGAIEAALHELGRSEPDSRVAALELLVRAAREARGGNAARSEELLSSLHPTGDELLDTWKQAIRIQAARATSIAAEESLLEDLSAWARASESREARRLGWLGNLRYRQNRFAEAAELHQRSADLRTGAEARLSEHVNAAGALLEALRLDEAAALAHRAESDARTLRNARNEAQAAWMRRVADYRLERAGDVRRDLVEAASAVSPYLEALFAFHEASVAWRARLMGDAAELAGRAADRLEALGRKPQAMLARALELVARGTRETSAIEETAQRARECPVPDFAVQALGLLRTLDALSEREREELRREATRLACRPFAEWDTRLDVLSFREATADDASASFRDGGPDPPGGSPDDRMPEQEDSMQPDPAKCPRGSDDTACVKHERRQPHWWTRYKKELEKLKGEPSAVVTPPQFHEGNISICRSSAVTTSCVGNVYTTKPGSWVEDWRIESFEKFRSADELELTADDGKPSWPPAGLREGKAEESSSVRSAEFAYEYHGVPDVPVPELPEEAGEADVRSFDVRTGTALASAPVTGHLYRAELEVEGTLQWVTLWTLGPDYEEPEGTTKMFLVAGDRSVEDVLAEARKGARSSYRFVAAIMSWTPWVPTP